MRHAAHRKGEIAGAAILTLFGTEWLIGALAAWRTRPNWSLSAAVAAGILLLLWCVIRFKAVPSTTGANDPAARARGRAEGKRMGTRFGMIFGLELGLIVLCSVLLARYGLALWIPLVVAVIVGLHFVPLARVFHVPVYYSTAALTTLGALACLLIHDPGTRLLCVGLEMAAVLWGTVVVLLAQSGQPQLGAGSTIKA